LAEVVLRCHPVPETEQWWAADGVDPFDLHSRLFRPLAVLWDGTRTHVGLAGNGVDVALQVRSILGSSFEQVVGPPTRPGPGRLSLAPAALRSLSGAGWLAEIGVGVVHCDPVAAVRLPPSAAPAPEVIALHRAIKERFDPTGRLNPGRSPLLIPAPVPA
jgi:glycolate oxidase FAD binding subunit